MPDIVLNYGFTYINPGDFFRLSTWTKGVKLQQAHHVDQLVEIISDNLDSRQIKGRCLPQTSINNNLYPIIITVCILHIMCICFGTF